MISYWVNVNVNALNLTVVLGDEPMGRERETVRAVSRDTWATVREPKAPRSDLERPGAPTERKWYAFPPLCWSDLREVVHFRTRTLFK